jgi:urease accessory protein
MKTAGKLLLLSVLVLALPIFAQAHPGHDGHDLTWSFNTGFGHPLSGWDHLLAMVAVGLWAAVLGGRARWLVPAAFVGTMMIGAIGGHLGLSLPGIEQGIAASLFVLGLLIAFSVRLPVALSMGVVALFALFHGCAHGAEMPATSSGLTYGAGFVLATALLHATGLGLGTLLHKQPSLARITGGAVAAAGVLAWVG